MERSYNPSPPVPPKLGGRSYNLQSSVPALGMKSDEMTVLAGTVYTFTEVADLPLMETVTRAACSALKYRTISWLLLCPGSMN